MFAARTCGNADNASLLRGTLGSADNELVLAFDPEVRRIIRDIGQPRDKRRARRSAVQRRPAHSARTLFSTRAARERGMGPALLPRR